MIYVKIIVSTCIVFLSTYIGILKSNTYIKRENILRDFLKLIQKIKVDINYTQNKLSNIIEENTENLDHEIKENIWNVEKIDYLSNQDKKILKDYLDNVGKKDIESENSLVEATIESIKNQIEEAKEDVNKNSKMYQKLGLLVGIGIVIITI